MTVQDFLSGRVARYTGLDGRIYGAQFLTDRDIGLTYVRFTTEQGRTKMKPLMDSAKAACFFEQEIQPNLAA